MFIFGHLGIGSKLVSPWSKRLPFRWILVGTLLPDLIDKPLYYGLVLTTGRRAEELGLISGTRTLGHTGLFLLLLVGIAIARKSKPVAALALGLMTHLLLDNLSERFFLTPQAPGTPTTLWALFFPLLGFRFPVMPFRNADEHLGTTLNTVHLVAGEALGILLLGWEAWKSRHRPETLRRFRERKSRFRKRFQKRPKNLN